MEALWRPYVDQADVDARFHLADFYLNYVYDDGSQKEMEMKELLSRAADEGHADATYRLRQQYPAGAERDALLLKAGELGSLEAQRDLGALYATGDWSGSRDPVRATEWIDVRRNAVTRMHSTISASCTCSAKACRPTRMRDCDGCDALQIRKTSALFDYLLMCIATASTEFLLMQWKRSWGRRGIERQNSICYGCKSGAKMEPRLRSRSINR